MVIMAIMVIMVISILICQNHIIKVCSWYGNGERIGGWGENIFALFTRGVIRNTGLEVGNFSEIVTFTFKLGLVNGGGGMGGRGGKVGQA